MTDWLLTPVLCRRLTVRKLSVLGTCSTGLGSCVAGRSALPLTGADVSKWFIYMYYIAKTSLIAFYKDLARAWVLSESITPKQRVVKIDPDKQNKIWVPSCLEHNQH
jgi:hypothetical protein